MSNGRLFLAIGLAALFAGSASWLALRPALPRGQPALEAPEISASAMLATAFEDGSGRSRSLAEFPGKVLVVNFWATWCAPCRAEMPAFDRLNDRWAERGVRFVGLSAESQQAATAFGRINGIRYPLWTASGETVPELSRRLGNRLGVLPHTLVMDASGKIIEQRVGPYTEAELEDLLKKLPLKAANFGLITKHLKGAASRGYAKRISCLNQLKKKILGVNLRRKLDILPAVPANSPAMPKILAYPFMKIARRRWTCAS